MVNKALAKVSVIIPTLDRSAVLLNSVKDVLKQTYPNFEIIIVDQTKRPAKDVLTFCHQHQNKIKYLHLFKKGSSHARNVGVKKSSGEILLFLDDDIRINNPNFISYHVENFQDPAIAIVSGRVVEDFKMKDPHRKEVGKIKYFGLVDIPNFDATQRMKIDRAMSCNMSVNKKIFNQVGSFREIYLGTAHLEESDFCLKVKRSGYEVIFDPRPVTKHLLHNSGGNRAKNVYDMRYWKVRNNIIFILVNYNKLVFILGFFQKGFWAASSALKRWDWKMFQTMFGAIIDGYRYYQQIKSSL